jgi:hypothetical protein
MPLVRRAALCASRRGFLFEPQTYKTGLRYLARNRVMRFWW